MANLILARKDEPDYQIELVRWQAVPRGWWGYTATMLRNHRTPCVFVRDTWQIPSQTSGPS